MELCTREEPLQLLERWLAEARESAAERYFNAACLCTVDERGAADGRMVLVHLASPRALLFTTDSRSKKARDLADHPAAALVFHWQSLERQIRIRGTVRSASRDAAVQLFRERPEQSRVTAWASEQSAPVASRVLLEEQYAAAARKLSAVAEIDAPESWTAYELQPDEIEFWEARPARLHERLLYRHQTTGWLKLLLQP